MNDLSRPDSFDRALELMGRPEADSDLFRPDPKRPGYCHAWKITYLRGSQVYHGERFFARHSEAEATAAKAMREDIGSVFGPLKAEVREVFTHESCLDVNRDDERKRLASHKAFNRQVRS